MNYVQTGLKTKFANNHNLRSVIINPGICYGSGERTLIGKYYDDQQWIVIR